MYQRRETSRGLTSIVDVRAVFTDVTHAKLCLALTHF